MTAKEFLHKRLPIEEVNELLQELLGYSCHYEDNIRYVNIQVFDEDGDEVNVVQIVGYVDLHIVYDILLLKETIDKERGFRKGITETRTKIKEALGIS